MTLEVSTSFLTHATEALWSAMEQLLSNNTNFQQLSLFGTSGSGGTSIFSIGGLEIQLQGSYKLQSLVIGDMSVDLQVLSQYLVDCLPSLKRLSFQSCKMTNGDCLATVLEEQNLTLEQAVFKRGVSGLPPKTDRGFGTLRT
jgi:hypothetical protein